MLSIRSGHGIERAWEIFPEAQGNRGSQDRIQRVHPDVGFPRRMDLGDLS